MNQQFSPKQLELFPSEKPEKTPNQTSTFSDNLSLPIHRWFRYSAGFSATWVTDIIQQEKAKGRHRILDPFVGSGTTLLAAESCNVEAIGIEAHPFIARIAKIKLYWRENPLEFRKYALGILREAKSLETTSSTQDISEYPQLIHKCFTAKSLNQLNSIKKALENRRDNGKLSELTWLALTSILRECSTAGTAQWQYVLPNKTKTKIREPYEAFLAKIYLMGEDMIKQQQNSLNKAAILYREDARECNSIPDGWADLIITSPPYANNYDYADATRLEMSFLGEISGWGDLQKTVRQYLIRSCTQHAAKLNKEIDGILKSPLLAPIFEEITNTCNLLSAERKDRGGKKSYHAMVAAYFSDMAKVWLALRRVTVEGGLVIFVVGDSAPYGVYVPVDRWLGELALAAGFKTYKFEKIRDRNTKWKNRKHRVPLHEGILWVEG